MVLEVGGGEEREVVDALLCEVLRRRMTYGACDYEFTMREELDVAYETRRAFWDHVIWFGVGWTGDGRDGILVHDAVNQVPRLGPSSVLGTLFCSTSWIDTYGKARPEEMVCYAVRHT